jgi:hypothetical protein
MMKRIAALLAAIVGLTGCVAQHLNEGLSRSYS